MPNLLEPHFKAWFRPSLKADKSVWECIKLLLNLTKLPLSLLFWNQRTKLLKAMSKSCLILKEQILPQSIFSSTPKNFQYYTDERDLQLFLLLTDKRRWAIFFKPLRLICPVTWMVESLWSTTTIFLLLMKWKYCIIQPILWFINNLISQCLSLTFAESFLFKTLLLILSKSTKDILKQV